MFLQKLHKYLTTFRAIFKNVSFKVKTALALMGTTFEKFGYFLFQHLVTLKASLSQKCEISNQVKTVKLFFRFVLGSSVLFQLLSTNATQSPV